MNYFASLAARCALALCLTGAFLTGCSQPEVAAPPEVTIGGTGVPGPFDEAVQAAIEGNLSYVQQCVQSDPLYAQGFDDRGRTLLHYAAEANQEAVVKYLLENGARANAQDNDGYYPLDTASQGQASKAVMDLLREAAAREAGGVQ